jgi:molecular chaperone HscB
MDCSACKKPAGDGLVCQACGALLPPRPVDEFAALGVARRFELDDAELDARYRELSRKLHPDRFARADARQRMWSMQATTTLNQAYKRLKAPLARAEALLALGGLTIGENEQVEGPLLFEIMELRERLEEQRDVAAVQATAREKRDAALAEVARGFAAAAPNLPAIKAALIAIRYYDRLLEAAAA